MFRNVYDLNIDLKSLNIQIDEISRQNPTKPKNYKYIEDYLEYEWLIQTTVGDISFKSIGFDQFGKEQPKITQRPYMDSIERGGFYIILTNAE